MRGSTTIVAGAALALLACSDAPRSVPTSSQSTPTQLPAGHPPLSSELPPDHPSLEQPAHDPSIEFGGRVRLVGALAEVKTGFVFVSVRPQAQKGPLLTYRIDLADPKLTEPLLVTAADGVRELNFLLNQRTSMMPGEVPKNIALELQLLYDPDGDIDSKDGRFEAVTPTNVGASGIVLDLGAPASK